MVEERVQVPCSLYRLEATLELGRVMSIWQSLPTAMLDQLMPFWPGSLAMGAMTATKGDGSATTTTTTVEGTRAKGRPPFFVGANFGARCSVPRPAIGPFSFDLFIGRRPAYFGYYWNAAYCTAAKDQKRFFARFA